MKARIVAVLITLFGTGFCLVRAYSVEPHSAQLSGWTHGEDGYVSEVITVSFDEPITASLFCGGRGAGGTYDVNIYIYPGGVLPLARKLGAVQQQDHSWLTCSLTVLHPDSFIKGRQVEVRWTRSGSDSLQYYWSDGDPYKYGFLSASGSHAGQDLAMRCNGHSKVDGQATSV